MQINKKQKMTQQIKLGSAEKIMKGLKVYNLSKFSNEEAKEIAEKGFNVAGDFLYVNEYSAELIEQIIKKYRKAKSDEEKSIDVKATNKFSNEDVLNENKNGIYNYAKFGKVEKIDYSKKTNRNF